MTMARRDIVAGLILIVFGLFYAYLVVSLPERSVMPNTPGPSFFPTIIIAVIFILSAALLGNGIVEVRKGDAHGKKGLQEGQEINRKSLYTLVVFVGYLLFLPYLGLVIASIAFFAILMYFYGNRNRLIITIASLIIPSILYLVFRYGFQIILPRGILPF